MTHYAIPDKSVRGQFRLGRHINHDPRSLNYLVPATGIVKSQRWTRVAPILDQGSDGSCTVEAGVGVLGTAPFVGTFTEPAGLFTQDYIKGTLYRWETENDSFPGSWPTTDSGSDGLSSAKTMKHFGFINGYQHITSVAAAQSAIALGPFIVGSDWLSGMDNPDANGVVQATGATRGGHEYECVGFDADKGLWEFCNSWGDGWGKAGHFFYSTEALAGLLRNGGDATVFVPLTQPAPVPSTFTPNAADLVLAEKATFCTKRSRPFKTWKAALGL